MSWGNSRSQTRLVAGFAYCGFLNVMDEYRVDGLSLDDRFFKNPTATYPIQVVGNSMQPLICDGDIVLVDNSLPPKHRDIVLAIYEGVFTIKRLIQRGSNIFLYAENKSVKPLMCSETNTLEIRGVVTSIHRPIRS